MSNPYSTKNWELGHGAPVVSVLCFSSGVAHKTLHQGLTKKKGKHGEQIGSRGADGYTITIHEIMTNIKLL